MRRPGEPNADQAGNWRKPNVNAAQGGRKRVCEAAYAGDEETVRDLVEEAMAHNAGAMSDCEVAAGDACEPAACDILLPNCCLHPVFLLSRRHLARPPFCFPH